MSETWTEYAVRFKSGWTSLPVPRRDVAEAWVKSAGGTVVGRTVTASDWLPVDSHQTTPRTEK